MRNSLLLLLLLFFFNNNNLFSQNDNFVADDIDLNIILNNENKLILTITNKNKTTIKIKPLHSKENYLSITNPKGSNYSLVLTLCTDEELIDTTLNKREGHFYVYNLNDGIFNPIYSSFGTFIGTYEIYWTVNGIQSKPFFYEKI